MILSIIVISIISFLTFYAGWTRGVVVADRQWHKLTKNKYNRKKRRSDGKKEI